MKKITLLFFLITGCATDFPQKKGQTQAEATYKEAKELMESGRYLLAIERLNQLKSNFPYSYYAKYTDLLMADIYFYKRTTKKLEFPICFLKTFTLMMRKFLTFFLN